jgi:hypothetical protein
MKPCETESGFQRLHSDLHDLCQPLTALQCRLEIGKMLGEDAAMREAVDGALEETQRMFSALAKIRASLLQAETAAR